MDAEERNNLFEKFIKNGMNIEEFKFKSVNDKKNLFAILEEYLKSMITSDRKLMVLPNLDYDVTIYLDDREICMFELDYDFRTIRCHTSLMLDDEDLIFCMTMFFLTMKELKTMIQILSKSFSKIKSKETHATNKGKYKSLTGNTKDIVNKIESIQESILKNINKNKKYITDNGKDKK